MRKKELSEHIENLESKIFQLRNDFSDLNSSTIRAVVNCEKCKCLIRKEDAVKGKSEIRERKTKERISKSMGVKVLYKSITTDYTYLPYYCHRCKPKEKKEEEMREIKFRAWDKIEKKMYLVDCISWNSKRKVEIVDLFLGDEKNDVMFNRGFEDIILQQYTGLKDKNGKEIYEGDILRYTIRGKYVQNGKVFRTETVEWNDEYTGWYPFIKIYNNDQNYTEKEYGDYEVIGNIYENPELLEKK